MSGAGDSSSDWDVCPGCGERHGQPESARFDEDGRPVSTPTWHRECLQARMREPLGRKGDGTVFMYEGPDSGPLSD